MIRRRMLIIIISIFVIFLAGISLVSLFMQYYNPNAIEGRKDISYEEFLKLLKKGRILKISYYHAPDGCGGARSYEAMNIWLKKRFYFNPTYSHNIKNYPLYEKVISDVAECGAPCKDIKLWTEPLCLIE